MSVQQDMTKCDGKADGGKVRSSLLHAQFGEHLEGVAGVLTFGANKYPKPPLDNSWRDVPNGQQRYLDALYRHLTARFSRGEKNDAESGYDHVYHVMCNLLFLLELEKNVTK